MPRYKLSLAKSRLLGALEILRSEAYLAYAATTKDERNPAKRGIDGLFSAAC